MLTRRAALAALALLARPAIAQSRLRVVVLGGGPGGAAAARMLAVDSRIAVTLVDQSPIYSPPWLFNGQLGRVLTDADTDFGFDGLATRGITVRTETATAVDPGARHLVLQSGDPIAYDRLILAPGIAFQPGIPGADPGTAGWTSEAGVNTLFARLNLVPDGGTVVIATPGLPMRCPPAPYERASMIAHRLRTSGRPNARVMILDAKETGALLGLFQAGWETLQPGQVEWLPPSIHGGITRIEGNDVVTGLDTIKADLVCAIPPHGAGAVARPFADASGWCPVDPATMRVRGTEHVYIVGDAAILSPIPKSAVLAAASGRVAAAAILSELDSKPAPQVALDNLCWARLAPDNAIRSKDLFRLQDGTLHSVETQVSSPAESAAVRATAYAEAVQWSRSFGQSLYAP